MEWVTVGRGVYHTRDFRFRVIKLKGEDKFALYEATGQELRPLGIFETFEEAASVAQEVSDG